MAKTEQLYSDKLQLDTCKRKSNFRTFGTYVKFISSINELQPD